MKFFILLLHVCAVGAACLSSAASGDVVYSSESDQYYEVFNRQPVTVPLMSFDNVGSYHVALFKTNTKLTLTVMLEEGSMGVTVVARYGQPPLFAHGVSLVPNSTNTGTCFINATIIPTGDIVADSIVNVTSHPGRSVMFTKVADGTEVAGLQPGRLYVLVLPLSGYHVLEEQVSAAGSLVLSSGFELTVVLDDDVGTLVEAILLGVASVVLFFFFMCMVLAPEQWQRFSDAVWQAVDEHQAADTRALLLFLNEEHERERREVQRSSRAALILSGRGRGSVRPVSFVRVSARPMLMACMWAVHSALFRERERSLSKLGRKDAKRQRRMQRRGGNHVGLEDIKSFADVLDKLASVAGTLKIPLLDLNALTRTHWGAFRFFEEDQAENFNHTAHVGLATNGGVDDDDDGDSSSGVTSASVDVPVAAADPGKGKEAARASRAGRKAQFKLVPGTVEGLHLDEAQLDVEAGAGARSSEEAIALMVDIKPEDTGDALYTHTKAVLTRAAVLCAGLVLPIQEAFEKIIYNKEPLRAVWQANTTNTDGWCLDWCAMDALLRHVLNAVTVLETAFEQVHAALKRVNLTPLLTQEQVSALVRRYMVVLQQASALYEVILKGVDGVAFIFTPFPARQRPLLGAFGSPGMTYSSIDGSVDPIPPMVPEQDPKSTTDLDAKLRLCLWIGKLEAVAENSVESLISTGLQYQARVQSRQGSLKELVCGLSDAVDAVAATFSCALAQASSFYSEADAQDASDGSVVVEELLQLRQVAMGTASLLISTVTALFREVRLAANNAERLIDDPALVVEIMHRAQALEELLMLTESFRSSIGPWFSSLEVVGRAYAKSRGLGRQYKRGRLVPVAGVGGQPGLVVARRLFWVLAPSASLLGRLFALDTQYMLTTTNRIRPRLSEIPLPTVDAIEFLRVYAASLRKHPPDPRLEAYVSSTLLSKDKHKRDTHNPYPFSRNVLSPIEGPPSPTPGLNIPIADLFNYAMLSSARLPNPRVSVSAGPSSVQSQVPRALRLPAPILLPAVYILVLIARCFEAVVEVVRVIFNMSILHQALSVVFPSFSNANSFAVILSRAGEASSSQPILYNALLLMLDVVEGVRGLLSELDLVEAVEQSNFNCGGIIFIALPISLAAGVFVILFVVRRDALIFVGINLKNRAFRFSQPYRLLLHRLADLATILLLYTLQMIIISMLSLLTSRMTQFRRTCSNFDYIVGAWVGPIAMYVTVSLLMLFFIFSFSGTSQNVPTDLSWPLLLVWRAADAIRRLVLMIFGIWTRDSISAFRIHARAAVHNTSPQASNNQQEEVMRLLAKTNGLLYLLLPLGVFATKAQEAFNIGIVFAPVNENKLSCLFCFSASRKPVLDYDGTAVSLYTPFHERFFRALFAVAKYVCTVASVLYLDGPDFLIACGIVILAEAFVMLCYDIVSATTLVEDVRTFGNMAPI